MKTTLARTPLIELLPLAVERGAIDSWSVDGPHLVLRCGSDRLYVHPTVAGSFLVTLLGEGKPPRGANKRLMRVSLN